MQLDNFFDLFSQEELSAEIKKVNEAIDDLNKQIE